jgi:hypothetical protein
MRRLVNRARRGRTTPGGGPESHGSWAPAALLQVVADYTRLSAALAAGRAGRGRASGPQYPGVAEDYCRAGVTIRPGGPIPTLDRRLSAVLTRVSTGRTSP